MKIKTRKAIQAFPTRPPPSGQPVKTITLPEESAPDNTPTTSQDNQLMQENQQLDQNLAEKAATLTALKQKIDAAEENLSTAVENLRQAASMQQENQVRDPDDPVNDVDNVDNVDFLEAQVDSAKQQLAAAQQEYDSYARTFP